MDSSGLPPAYGNSKRCRVYPHPVCAACGNAIIRKYLHSHIYDERRGVDESLCRECHLLTITAATFLLGALHSVGVAPNSRELMELANAGHLGVYVQRPMEMEVSAN